MDEQKNGALFSASFLPTPEDYIEARLLRAQLRYSGTKAGRGGTAGGRGCRAAVFGENLHGGFSPGGLFDFTGNGPFLPYRRGPSHAGTQAGEEKLRVLQCPKRQQAH